MPFKLLRACVSIFAILLAVGHFVWPTLAVDGVTLVLLFIATLPWIGVLMKSVELPGGWKFEFAEISKQIIEENVRPEERAQLTRHQVISSNVWDGGYYKLYSNGVLTQRFDVMLAPEATERELTLPIAFPNEAVSAQILGDVDAEVTLLTSVRVKFKHAVQGAAKSVTVVVTGL